MIGGDSMKETIYRQDAIETVHKYFVEALNNEPHEIDEDGDDVFTDMKSVNALLRHNKMVSKALKALPSAEAEPKRVLQGYCKGADCRWWNPQVEGCNRCVFVKDEYTHPSAEAEQTIRHIENNTNESDLVYRPSAEAVHKPDYSYEADMVRRLKESLSAEAVREISEDCKPLFFGVDYGKRSRT